MHKNACDPFTVRIGTEQKVDDLSQSQKDWVEIKISGLLVQCPIHHHGFPVLLSY